MNSLAACGAVAVATKVLRKREDVQFTEVLQFVVDMAESLELQTELLVASLMMAQPLLLAWHDWRLALGIGVSYGCKAVFDGDFYLGDLMAVPYLHEAYGVHGLVHAEEMAFEKVQLTTIPSRLLQFRKAMVEVVLGEGPLVNAITIQRMQAVDAAAGDGQSSNRMHCIVVDDEANVTQYHEEMLRQLDSTLDVHCFSRADLAIAYFAQCLQTGYKVDLVLLDMELDTSDNGGFLRSGTQGGLYVAECIDELYLDFTASTDIFVPRPLIALVSGLVRSAAQQAACKHRGVDSVIRKPLTIGSLCVLLGCLWGCEEQEEDATEQIAQPLEHIVPPPPPAMSPAMPVVPVGA